MSKTCTKCGRQYERTYCEFCYREEQLTTRGKAEQFITKHFTPRIKKDLYSDLKFSSKHAKQTHTTVKELLNHGGGIMITGPVGSGKSIYAAVLTLEAYKLKFIEGWDYPNEFKFVAIPDLLVNIRSTFNDDSNTTDEQLIRHYSTVDWLVLDDLGAEKSSSWVLQMLYIIISRRYEYLKPTIFTSNYTGRELEGHLQDERIPSRINGMCKIIKMSETDYRRSK